LQLVVRHHTILGGRRIQTMANTYTQLYVQIVFAVRGRDHVIQREHNAELQKYMTGIVSHLGSKMIAINNMPDHFHLLVGLKPVTSVSELAGKVKSGSSNFIQNMGWIAGRFDWQEGFGAFSYSRSQLSTVIRYIENQENHHRHTTFREEYVKFLKRFGVQYDERYLLGWS
jgi:putative transposase